MTKIEAMQRIIALETALAPFALASEQTNDFAGLENADPVQFIPNLVHWFYFHIAGQKVMAQMEGYAVPTAGDYRNARKALERPPPP